MFFIIYYICKRVLFVPIVFLLSLKLSLFSFSDDYKIPSIEDSIYSVCFIKNIIYYDKFVLLQFKGTGSVVFFFINIIIIYFCIIYLIIYSCYKHNLFRSICYISFDCSDYEYSLLKNYIKRDVLNSFNPSHSFVI